MCLEDATVVRSMTKLTVNSIWIACDSRSQTPMLYCGLITAPRVVPVVDCLFSLIKKHTINTPTDPISYWIAIIEYFHFILTYLLEN